MKDRLTQLLLNIPDRLVEIDGVKVGKKLHTAESVAEYLIKQGVIVPPLRVGDEVYFILEDEMVEDGIYITPAHKVTEVGSRGFWISCYDPPENDMGDFIGWDELGKTCFITREEAEKNLKGANDEQR